MRTTPRVAGFRSEYPAGFELECMAGFVGIRSERSGDRRWRPLDQVRRSRHCDLRRHGGLHRSGEPRAAARALSTSFNDTPARASRPFDRDRDGFVMGEGAGVLVIEELEHALRRGAKPIAELTGYGTTADAYHITAGPEDGDGARRAMEAALRQAGLLPGEIQHLNAHSTSTPVGDLSELEAIKRVFGREGSVAVSATKSATGHLLGAAGGVEAIFTILALRDQVAPPTLNLENADPAAEGIDLVASVARPMAIEHAISNGFGFGGVNASLVFRRWS
ncbi:3-oxoacyl-(acyl-carrier-protein) synthase [Bradyrhizobium sp. i1.8.4]